MPFIAKPYLPEELYTRVALNLDMLDNVAALTHAATRDVLTGIFNRRSFFDLGNSLIAARRRSKSACAVAIMDIDFFKRVNDTYGHDGGDAVLRAIAKIVEQHAEPGGGDICAHLGGEEFAIMFNVANTDTVEPYFDKLRTAIANQAVPFKDTNIQVTASFGVAVSQDPALEAMISAADENLYKAKNDGRNRVVIG